MKRVSCGRGVDVWFIVVGGYVGRLAMIKSIPMGKHVCRSLGVICILWSGISIFHWGRG